MTKRAKIKSLYRKLNPEQKQAVDTIEGPVMVNAGPGTGKTYLLTMRIANILDKTDTPPEAILALTFTDSAVASMRRMMIDIIGIPAYRITITTFHGFANDIIKSYPDEFPGIIGSTNISNLDQIRIIRGIIDTMEFGELKKFGSRYYYLQPIIQSINELKREGISPDEFKKIVQEQEKSFINIGDLYHKNGRYEGRMKRKYIDEKKHIERNKELVNIYYKYQETLANNHFYDYNDMIMQVMFALENNRDLLLMQQEQYLYILVDEHQDTNSAQNRILELLSSYHNNPNVFVVGDEKQAIFRFQGASSENFSYFKNIYENIKLINLRNNYRSTQTILDAAYDLSPSNVNLVSQVKYQESPIEIDIFNMPEEERYFLSKSIKDLLKHKTHADQIAILYRENKDVIPIARVLEKTGIPFVIESNQDVLEDEDIIKLLIILETVRNFGSSPELIKMLHIDIFGIPPIDVYKLARLKLEKRHIDVYDAIRSIKIMRDAGIEKAEELRKIYHMLSRWNEASHNKGATQAFEDIVRESGFLNYILSRPSAPEKIAKLHMLFDQIKSLVENHKGYKLNDFFKYLDMIREHDVPIEVKRSVQIPGRVRLMTAHKSKGLEFDYVYIVNAVDGHWGSRRHRVSIKLPHYIYSLSNKTNVNFDKYNNNNDDDERNLFYVALTRARKKVFITYSKQNENGRNQLPTKFIQNINPKLIKQSDFSEYDKDLKKYADIEFSPHLANFPTVKEKEFLNQLFYDQGLSVTALNNYLECPWKYFYTSLIRIPEAPNKYLMFGTAIHETLKNYFDRMIRGEDLGKEYLINLFSNLLWSQPIQEEDYKEMLEKGRKALSGYYDNYHNLWNTNVLTEFNIRGIELDKNLVINGKIDKIEILDNANNVNVVDYKTGKPRSRNNIEGKTKSSKGDYKRQLVFYNLLLNHYQNGKFKMVSGEIDFVEPDDKGQYRKELFKITKEDIEELEETIRSVAKEIIDLSFWDKTCDNPNCNYCRLRKLMR